MLLINYLNPEWWWLRSNPLGCLFAVTGVFIARTYGNNWGVFKKAAPECAKHTEQHKRTADYGKWRHSHHSWTWPPHEVWRELSRGVCKKFTARFVDISFKSTDNQPTDDLHTQNGGIAESILSLSTLPFLKKFRFFLLCSGLKPRPSSCARRRDKAVKQTAAQNALKIQNHAMRVSGSKQTSIEWYYFGIFSLSKIILLLVKKW